LVLALLGTAVVAYRFDLGARWFGWRPIDPSAQPAAVLPPVGLKLPRAAPVRPVAGQAGETTPQAALVAAAVRPLVRREVLGGHLAVVVTDERSGRTVLRMGAPRITPASTAKLLTTTAALEVLGPMARFSTTVRWLPATRTLVLVGGGDPFLASSPGSPGASYPRRADLTTLAALVARHRSTLGPGRVHLAYDDSYFTGPAVNPAWEAGYVPDVVAPTSALWVDEARAASGSGFVEDPAPAAAKVFHDRLAAAGVRVLPRVVRRVAPPDAVEVGSVRSAPLGEIVERTLAVSDNNAAEVLARHVGLAQRQQGTSAAGAAAVLAVVRRLGVTTAGDRLVDGSGLARVNRLDPASLAGVVRLAQEQQRPALRQVFTGLPVAGFTGSLAERFDQGPAAARGRVRAKTGTLTGVHALAGTAEDLTGARMDFVVVADRVPPTRELEAQTLVDRIAGALGACRCGVGSSS
ncbi:MAG: dacB, partial [Marmoricola sp.]|nr:dacB [Marmoricola sp.]